MAKIFYHFVLVFFLVVEIYCGAGSEEKKEAEDNKMAFETKDVAYPVRYANFQRNSQVPVEMKSKWNPVWFKKYSDINIEYSFIPFNVLVKDNLIGVRYDAEMLLFDTGGNLVYQMPLSGSAGV
ncbi:MAG: hypothetical protein DRP51_04210, partial [Candidatus Zixiibacteriota bacterium]